MNRRISLFLVAILVLASVFTGCQQATVEPEAPVVVVEEQLAKELVAAKLVET